MTRSSLGGPSAWLAACIFIASSAVGAVAMAQPVVPAPAMRQPTLPAAIDAVLARRPFNGVVLVRRRHERPIVRTFGVADVAAHRASSGGTLYQTGSFSKWVASLIVLRLADQGKVALDVPISTYLPDYRPDTGARITLHTLLSHTSGVPNEMGAALGKNGKAAAYAGLSVTEAVKRYASGNLLFDPGSRFDYSHSNWLIVEAIIERVTGKTYRQTVRDLLTAPLHLTASGIIPADFGKLPDAAAAYSTLVPEPALVPPDQTVPFPAIVGPFGGYYASAPDMLRLLDAVYDTDFLSAASRQALWRVNVPDQHYAYGGRSFLIDLGDGVRKVARNNNSNGAYKTFDLRVDDGTTILLFNNTRMDQQQLNDMGDDLLTAIYPTRRP